MNFWPKSLTIKFLHENKSGQSVFSLAIVKKATAHRLAMAVDRIIRTEMIILHFKSKYN